MALCKCKECGNKVSTKAKTCPSCGAPIKKRTSVLTGCLAIIIFGVFAVVCTGVLTFDGSLPPPNSRNSSAKRPPAPAETSPEQATDQGPAIPDDVSFTTIDTNTVPGIKRSLDIRLNKTVSEETLRAIAIKLKADEPRDFERTFIAYYLPDMAVGAGAWATTHFNPKLEVRVLGLTAEAEKMLAKEPAHDSREVIGRWLDSSPFVGGRITIFRDSGKVYFEQTFKDGSALTEELLEKPSSIGQRYNMAIASYTGDHWIIDGRGNLQIRDNQGLITTAKKID